MGQGFRFRAFCNKCKTHTEWHGAEWLAFQAWQVGNVKAVGDIDGPSRAGEA